MTPASVYRRQCSTTAARATSGTVTTHLHGRWQRRQVRPRQRAPCIGRINAVTISNPGSGYTSTPTVSFPAVNGRSAPPGQHRLHPPLRCHRHRRWLRLHQCARGCLQRASGGFTTGNRHRNRVRLGRSHQPHQRRIGLRHPPHGLHRGAHQRNRQLPPRPLSKSNGTLTITALGRPDGDNYNYSGPSATGAPYNQQKTAPLRLRQPCTTPTPGNATCNTASSVTHRRSQCAHLVMVYRLHHRRGSVGRSSLRRSTTDASTVARLPNADSWSSPPATASNPSTRSPLPSAAKLPLMWSATSTIQAAIDKACPATCSSSTHLPADGRRSLCPMQRLASTLTKTTQLTRKCC